MLFKTLDELIEADGEIVSLLVNKWPVVVAIYPDASMAVLVLDDDRAWRFMDAEAPHARAIAAAVANRE